MLDCVATSFGSVEGAEALCSKLQGNCDTRLPDGDLVEVRSTLVMVLPSKTTSLSRLPVQNDALGAFWVPVHLCSDQPMPIPLMLGMDFLKEHLCVINYGQYLRQLQFPMQPEC